MNEVSLDKAVLSTDVVFYTFLVYEGFGKYLMTALMEEWKWRMEDLWKMLIEVIHQACLKTISSSLTVNVFC